MVALMFIIPIAVIIVALVFGHAASPYRIEERVLGAPPRKVFFVYEQGFHLRSVVHFYTLDEAKEWVADATAVQRGLPLPSKKD